MPVEPKRHFRFRRILFLRHRFVSLGCLGIGLYDLHAFVVESLFNNFQCVLSNAYRSMPLEIDSSAMFVIVRSNWSEKMAAHLCICHISYNSTHASKDTNVVKIFIEQTSSSMLLFLRIARIHYDVVLHVSITMLYDRSRKYVAFSTK